MVYRVAWDELRVAIRLCQGGRSQREMAACIPNITYSTLSKFLGGRPMELKQLLSLCDSLQLPIEEVIVDDDNQQELFTGEEE